MKPLAEVSASDLPFLITHGAWLWKVALAILVITSLVIARWIARAMIRRTTQRKVEEHTALAKQHGEILLHGIVRVGRVTTVAQETHSNSERSPLVQVESDGQVFDLVGPVTVSYGTTEKLTYGPSKSLAPELGRGLRPFVDTHIRTIREGDEVVVRAIPASTDTSGAHQVLVDAYVSAAKRPVTPLVSVRWAIAALSCTVAWLLIFVGGGAYMTSAVKKVKPGVEVVGNRRIQLAAALPGAREEAFRKIAWELDRSSTNERFVRQQLAFTQLQGGCPDDILASAGRVVEALAMARRCAPDRVAIYLVRLGHYAEANQLLVESDGLATEAAIGAGDWLKAARAAEYRAAQTEPQFVSQLTCAAALFRSFAGEQTAFASRDGSADNDFCLLAEILAKPVAEQAAAFQSYGEELYYRMSEFWVAAGGTRYIPYDFISSRSVWPWLAPQALEMAPDPELRTLRICESVRRDLIFGDVASARAHLEQCVSAAGPPELIRELQHEIAVRHPTLSPPVPFLAADHDREVVDHGTPDSEGAKLLLAALGHGELLARDRYILTFSLHDYDGPRLARIFSLVQTHRAELAHKLGWHHRSGLVAENFPFGDVVMDGWYRDLHRILGDEEEAAYRQAIVSRHAEALTDMQRVTGFAFWNLVY